MFWAILHKSVVDAFFWVQAAISLPPLHAPSVVANIARVQMIVRLNLLFMLERGEGGQPTRGGEGEGGGDTRWRTRSEGGRGSWS